MAQIQTLIHATIVSCDFQYEIKLVFFCCLFFTFYNISAADAVVSEPEEVRGATEGSAVAVVSDPSEQAAEMSSEQGECLKTHLLKRTRWLSFD